MKPSCSILIPSLWRFDKLLDAVSSFFDTADDSDNIEILVRLHKSDMEARLRHKELPDRVAVVWGADKQPGQGNEVLWNELRRYATGDWHQYWSDDMVINGKGWDTQLAALPLTGVVAQPEIHCLGASVYGHNADGPVPFIPATAFTGDLPDVPDKAIYNGLVLQRGWRVEFLPGIGVSHNRVEDATAALSNAT